MAKGLYTRQQVGSATLSSWYILVRLIAFGIDCLSFTWSLCSSANRQLSTYGLSSLLYSQRLRSKTIPRFALSVLSLTRRPTHNYVQSFLGKDFLGSAVAFLRKSPVIYLHPSSEEAIFLLIGLQYLPGVISHSSAVRLIVFNRYLVRFPWKRCCLPASISSHLPSSIVGRGYLPPLLDYGLCLGFFDTQAPFGLSPQSAGASSLALSIRSTYDPHTAVALS
jgi:hypothetical protein